VGCQVWRQEDERHFFTRGLGIAWRLRGIQADHICSAVAGQYHLVFI
jgi:hypothetical protein